VDNSKEVRSVALILHLFFSGTLCENPNLSYRTHTIMAEYSREQNVDISQLWSGLAQHYQCVHLGRLCDTSATKSFYLSSRSILESVFESLHNMQFSGLSNTIANDPILNIVDGVINKISGAPSINSLKEALIPCCYTVKRYLECLEKIYAICDGINQQTHVCIVAAFLIFLSEFEMFISATFISSENFTLPILLQMPLPLRLVIEVSLLQCRDMLEVVTSVLKKTNNDETSKKTTKLTNYWPLDILTIIGRNDIIANLQTGNRNNKLVADSGILGLSAFSPQLNRGFVQSLSEINSLPSTVSTQSLGVNMDDVDGLDFANKVSSTRFSDDERMKEVVYIKCDQIIVALKLILFVYLSRHADYFNHPKLYICV
jgi:hypothetical protein